MHSPLRAGWGGRAYTQYITWPWSILTSAQTWQTCRAGASFSSKIWKHTPCCQFLQISQMIIKPSSCNKICHQISMAFKNAIKLKFTLSVCIDEMLSYGTAPVFGSIISILQIITNYRYILLGYHIHISQYLVEFLGHQRAGKLPHLLFVDLSLKKSRQTLLLKFLSTTKKCM